jgi:hypothetical protein
MTTTTTETARVSVLVFDGTIYPRATVSNQRVSRIAEAIRAGAALPPIIAERQGQRIIDGVHRRHAYVQALGPQAEVPVEWRDYPDEAAMFRDAAAINATHGEPLSSFDLAHCLDVARRLRVPDTALPQVLSLTRDKIKQMKGERFATGPGRQTVLLKRSNRHLAGQHINRRQMAGNTRSDGLNLTYHANQLINALENDLADLSAPGLATALARLKALLP